MDHREIFLEQRVAGDDRDLGLVFVSQAARSGFKLCRTHVRGRGVDQVAGEKFRLCHDRNPVGIDAFGCDQRRMLFRVVLVPVEAVAGQEPTQRFLLKVIRVDPAFDAVGAGCKFRQRRCKGKSVAFARSGCPVADQGHRGVAGVVGDHQRRSDVALERAGFDPGADAVALLPRPEGDILCAQNVDWQSFSARRRECDSHGNPLLRCREGTPLHRRCKWNHRDRSVPISA